MRIIKISFFIFLLLLLIVDCNSYRNENRVVFYHQIKKIDGTFYLKCLNEPFTGIAVQFPYGHELNIPEYVNVPESQREKFKGVKFIKKTSPNFNVYEYEKGKIIRETSFNYDKTDRFKRLKRISTSSDKGMVEVVDIFALDKKDKIYYLKKDNTPFTGIVYDEVVLKEMKKGRLTKTYEFLGFSVREQFFHGETGKIYREIEYYPSGFKKFVQHFNKEEKKHGKFIAWWDGGMKQYEAELKNGEPIRTMSWYENGQKWMKEEFKDGKRVSVIEWTKDGEVKSKNGM